MKNKLIAREFVAQIMMESRLIFLTTIEYHLKGIAVQVLIHTDEEEEGSSQL